jgi:hypothetical protein
MRFDERLAFDLFGSGNSMGKFAVLIVERWQGRSGGKRGYIKAKFDKNKMSLIINNLSY